MMNLPRKPGLQSHAASYFMNEEQRGESDIDFRITYTVFQAIL
jgi:hypothetical protein